MWPLPALSSTTVDPVEHGFFTRSKSSSRAQGRKRDTDRKTYKVTLFTLKLVLTRSLIGKTEILGDTLTDHQGRER